jgi:predicted metalloprotease with PDZ domain
MKQSFFIFSVSLILFVGVLRAQDLRFTIIPQMVGADKGLHVTLDFVGEADGETWLYYSDNQFGEPNQFQFLEVLYRNAQIIPDSNRIIIKHKPNERVQFRYKVMDKQAASEPFYKYCCYKPMVHDTFFHVQSGHLLVYPEEMWPDNKARRRVVFEWENLPKAQIQNEVFAIHSSFGAGSHQGGYLTQSEMSYGVFVGGDFRTHQFDVQGKPVYFLTRGKWSQFTDDTLVTILKRTFEGHRALWRDFSDTIYTVTFIPVDDAPWSSKNRVYSVGGSGLTNSFLSYATNNEGSTLGPIRYVYVHELMHRWIGTRIENAHEEQEYWFSEGFTDYFTYKTMLKYDLITLDDWLKEFNSQVLNPHYMSIIKARPNIDLNYEKFWNGGKEWEKLPYRRGAIYAFYLDCAIRNKSKGTQNLEFVLRDLLAECSKSDEIKFDHALFLKALSPYLGKRTRSDFKQYIEKGKPIDLSRIKLPKGLGVKHSSGVISSGPSREVITEVRAYQNVPHLFKKMRVNDADLRAALIE